MPSKSPAKPRDVRILKEIALLGGIEEYVNISSREIGEKIGFTQQTASNWILDLLKRGYIQRRGGGRKQGMKITSKGLDVLRAEHADYIRIFELDKPLIIMGKVVSGLGEGKYYISQVDYKKQFLQKLYFEPYPGTLNIKLAGSEISKYQILHQVEGIEIEGFEKAGRTFGSVKCFLATIDGEECAVVVPKRTHHIDVLEIISKTYLRKALHLKDGQEIEITISL
jgi:riboflavin kinase